MAAAEEYDLTNVYPKSSPPPLARQSSHIGHESMVLPTCHQDGLRNCMSCKGDTTVDPPEEHGYVKQFKFNGKEMDVSSSAIESISEGSFGKISKYSAKNEENDVRQSVAVKEFSKKKDYAQEKRVSHAINQIMSTQDHDKYNIIPSYYSDDCDVIIMHEKDSDLNALNRQFPNMINSLLFRDVVTSIYHLVKDHDMYYTDLKPGNIIYQMVGNKPKIYLADLGGIVFGNEFSIFEENDIDFFADVPQKEYTDDYSEKGDQLGIFTFPMHPDDAAVEIKAGDEFPPVFYDNFIQQIVSFAIFCSPQYRIIEKFDVNTLAWSQKDHHEHQEKSKKLVENNEILSKYNFTENIVQNKQECESALFELKDALHGMDAMGVKQSKQQGKPKKKTRQQGKPKKKTRQQGKPKKRGKGTR